MNEADYVRLERAVEQLKAENVKLARVYADLSRRIDELTNPPGPGLNQEPHVE